MRTIVIVGGGYCGTALATMLLRRPSATPTRLVLIERGVHVGRGVAFAARDFPYLLNVPAGRMSANPADPLEFLRFIQRREPGTMPRASCRAPGTATTSRSRSRQRRSRRPGTSGSTWYGRA
jgi:uncharacterized NAD(P)/FAD-binding protein YdhS